MPRMNILLPLFVAIFCILFLTGNQVEARRKQPVVAPEDTTASAPVADHAADHPVAAASETPSTVPSADLGSVTVQVLHHDEGVTVEEAERLTGLATEALSSDYSPETIQTTRRMDTSSKRIATFFLMYSRSEDVQKTLSDVFSSDISAGDLNLTQNSVTNSILARVKEGKSDLLKEISDVIASLDFRSGQVVIDVLVVDVTVTDYDLFNLEFKALSKNPMGTKDTMVTTGVDQGSIDKNDPTSVALDGFKALITSQDKLKIFLNAAKRKGDVKVVSSPHIVAANHRKATFKIGEKLFLISSIRPSDAGPIKSYSEKEVGLSLEVTPHINRGGQIDIEIDQSIDAVDSYDAKEGTARLINRKTATNITVNDGETIVLGGFIEDRRDNIQKRTPILSDIPFLGRAFTTTSKNTKKAELMVFLTPRVLDTSEEMRKETIAQRDLLTDKTRIVDLLRKRGLRDNLAATQTIIIEQRSHSWSYQLDTPETDVLVWQVPAEIDPESLKLPLNGACPFGFGSSKRLSPPFIKTYLKPSDGVVFKREFTLEDPIPFKTLSLFVASNNAAAIYINGKLVDEDPMMKLKDGHDFEYWNRVRDDISSGLLKPGKNTLVALLASDKTTTDGYFDMMLVGNR